MTSTFFTFLTATMKIRWIFVYKNSKERGNPFFNNNLLSNCGSCVMLNVHFFATSRGTIVTPKSVKKYI
jgi:hypothetical protein